jgi:TP901 family phage tail tape measure protein
MANPAVILKAEILGNAAGFVKAVGEAQNTLADFAQAAQDMFSKIALAAAGMGVAISGSMAVAGKAAADLETEVGKIISVVSTDLRGSELTESLTAEAKDIADQYGIAATAVAEAAYQAVSSGVEIGEAMEFAGNAAKASVAGFTDLSTIVKGTTDIMAVYGYKAKQAGYIQDVMFKAVALGKVEFKDLASYLGMVASQAAAMGVTFEELNAAIASMTLGGLKASTSVDYLRAMLTGIINPSKESQEAFQKLGIQYGATALKGKGLQKYLTELMAAIKRSGKDPIVVLSELFKGTEALQAVLNLTGREMENFNYVMEGMGKNAGAAQDAFDAFANTANFRMAVAFNQLKNLIATLGSSVNIVVAPFIGAFGKMASAVRALVQANQPLFNSLATIAAVLAAVSIVVAGLAGAFVLLTGAVAGFTAIGFLPLAVAVGIFSAVFMPLLLAIVAAAGFFIAKFEELKTVVSARWNEIAAIFQSGSTRIQAALIAAGQKIMTAFGFKSTGVTAKQFVDDMILKFQNLTTWLVDVGIPKARDFFISLIEWGQKALPIIKGLAENIIRFASEWGPLIIKIGGAAAAFLVVNAVLKPFVGLLTTGWGLLKGIKLAVVALAGVIGAPWTIAIGIILALIGTVYYFRDELWGIAIEIGNFFFDMWNSFSEWGQSAFEDVIGYVKDFVPRLMENLKSVGEWISWAWGKITGIGSAIGSAVGSGTPAANIPQAANGGLLTGPKSGYLAMLHGTELVVPERMIPAISNSTMNQSSMVFNITQSDGESTEALANRIAEIWNRRRR